MHAFFSRKRFTCARIGFVSLLHGFSFKTYPFAVLKNNAV